MGCWWSVSHTSVSGELMELTESGVGSGVGTRCCVDAIAVGRHAIGAALVDGT